METHKPYPSDVSAEEWFFVAPYLGLVREEASQRTYNLREVFNALRWIVRAGASWRMLPHPYHRFATRLRVVATPGEEPEVELATVWLFSPSIPGIT
jgi:transposase